MESERKINILNNNSKCSQEMRVKTVKFILDSGQLTTSVTEELGIDVNTVFRWVREYRRKNNLLTYAEEKGIIKRS